MVLSSLWGFLSDDLAIDLGTANTLIYVLQHANREAAVESWAAFRGDPEWQEAARASQEDGAIVDNVVSVFMDPTDFSAIR